MFSNDDTNMIYAFHHAIPHKQSLFKAPGVLNEKSLRVKEVDGELVER